MSRSLQISIPQPCHEDWATMTPATQGRHCAACAKTVVDFSRMTDVEVVNWFTRPPVAGSVCGRFSTSQLQQPLPMPAHLPFGWPRRTLAALFTLLGLSVTVPAVAQLRPDSVTVQSSTLGRMVATPAQTAPLKHLIRGQVIDATTELGLPGVTVLVEGTTNGVSTAADGTYELELSALDLTRKLVFSSIGYEVVIEPVGSANLLKPVAMKASCRMTGDVVITKFYTPRGLWNRLTWPFRR